MDWTWGYDAALVYTVMFPFWFLFILATGWYTYGRPAKADVLLTVVLAFVCTTIVWLIFGLIPGVMS